MVVDKCNPGYISNRKKISLLWLLFYIVLGVGIFLIGYFWMGTRANVLTVLAVLMVLPAAKRVVTLVVLVPRKGVSMERYDRMKQAVGEAILFTDYVFTSTEKIMHLDFVVIKNGNVLAVKGASRQDDAYMKQYLADSVRKAASGYIVRVFDEDELLIKHLSKLTQREGTPEKEEKVKELLRSFAV